MSAESARWSELTELVANHAFCNVNWNMFAPVMHSNCVTHHFREDGGRARPCFNNLLVVFVVHFLDSLQKAHLDERALFQTSAQNFLLISNAISYDDE